MTERRLIAALCAALLTCSTAAARAQAPSETEGEDQDEAPRETSADGASASTADETDEHDFRLRWSFPEVRPIEYLVGVGLPVAFRIINHNTFDPSQPRWTSSNFIDDGVQALIGDNTESTRRFADVLSDITWYATMAHPFVDTLLVALVLDGNPDLAWQMMAINIGAMALNGFVTLLSIRLAARSRPNTEICLEDGGTSEECAFDVRSFPSGHTSGSFTGAGLTCAHHSALPLYGGGLADGVACVAALTLATGTGLFRVVADKHHIIDVVAGAAIGLGSGWLLPWLLHYRHGVDAAPAEPARRGEGAAVAVVPFTDGQSAAGVLAGGVW